MRKIFALLIIITLPTLLVAQVNQAARNRPVVFRNVTLIDMASVKPNMTVLISGNRIAKIGRNIKTPKDAEVVDASEKFMIPGLWDSFTSTLEAVKNNFPYFEMMVAHGVTGVRDAGTTMDLAEAEQIQNDIVAGKILAPRLFYSGRYINGTNLPSLSHPSFQAKDANEAVHYVKMLAQAGVDYISIGTFLPPEFVPSVVAAKKYKLPVLAYVVYGYGRASDLGVNCIEHFADLDRSVSVKREDYFAFYRERRVNSVTPDEAYAFFKTLIDSRD
jgi:hypothetical protein